MSQSIDIVLMHSNTQSLVQHSFCFAVVSVNTILCVTGRRLLLRAKVAHSSAIMTELQRRPTKEP